jgi:anti-sigma regulatory factor (Ser/Thr protein kinase)
MRHSLLSLTMSSDATAPRRARVALRDLEDLDGIRDDADLVVSELVSNAVLHSGATDEDVITVDVSREDDVVRLAVHDPGRSQSTPTVQSPDPSRAGGLGLLVVSRLVRRWSAERPDGVLVWAEMTLPSPPSAVSGQLHREQAEVVVGGFGALQVTQAVDNRLGIGHRQPRDVLQQDIQPIDAPIRMALGETVAVEQQGRVTQCRQRRLRTMRSRLAERGQRL